MIDIIMNFVFSCMQAIVDCRFFTFFAIAGSLLGSVLCFVEVRTYIYINHTSIHLFFFLINS